MRIYNRLGELVFETQQADKGWDGSKNGVALPGDTYFYYVEVAIPFKGNKQYKGDITLIR
jgi:gliding motility-associated-like protein